jgi:uncharacterized protein (TIGR02118 family)
MAKLVVLYKTPADPAAFDRYYVDTHVPLAKRIPGMLRYEVNAGPVASPAGASPYHLVATLEFASMGALQQAMGSPEGRAAAADVPNFATGGVEMLIFDTKDV